MNCSKCEKKLKPIYEELWGKDFSISAQYKCGKSFKFVGEIGNGGELFQKIFNVSNSKMFENKYKQAISGAGDEAKKIATFHSSSRCSLMVFYNIEEKPIVIEIDGQDVVFNKSLFEVKNPVISAASNMDVVLISENRKVILFLESKFSEYIVGESLVEEGISTKYLDNEFSRELYNDDFLRGLGISVTIAEDNKTFSLKCTDGESVYLHGLKQMISHYIGIQRRLRCNKTDKRAEDYKRSEVQEMLEILKNPECFVYLGEVLFDFVNGEKNSTFDLGRAFEKYSNKYNLVAEKMNQVNRYPNRFKVLDRELKYSEIIKNNRDSIDDEVLRFYGFNE